MTGQGKCQQIVNANTLPFAYEHRGEMHVVRPSPAFHWKMGCTPLLDEAIHQSDEKMGVGTPN